MVLPMGKHTAMETRHMEDQHNFGGYTWYPIFKHTQMRQQCLIVAVLLYMSFLNLLNIQWMLMENLGHPTEDVSSKPQLT